MVWIDGVEWFWGLTGDFAFVFEGFIFRNRASIVLIRFWATCVVPESSALIQVERSQVGF